MKKPEALEILPSWASQVRLIYTPDLETEWEWWFLQNNQFLLEVSTSPILHPTLGLKQDLCLQMRHCLEELKGVARFTTSLGHGPGW